MEFEKWRHLLTVDSQPESLICPLNYFKSTSRIQDCYLIFFFTFYFYYFDFEKKKIILVAIRERKIQV